MNTDVASVEFVVCVSKNIIHYVNANKKVRYSREPRTPNKREKMDIIIHLRCLNDNTYAGF